MPRIGKRQYGWRFSKISLPPEQIVTEQPIILSNPVPSPSLPQLFVSFLRLGVTAFGGPSMVAYIRKLAVEQKQWLDAEIFNDGVALCQMIPGATAMQTAAYVGLKTRGVIGAGASFIGFGLPTFLLMMTFAALYTFTHTLPLVVSVFSGLQAIIVAIMANATLSFGKSTLRDWKTFAVAGLAALLFGLNVNPILVLVLAAVGGFVTIKPKQLVSRHSVPFGQTVSYTKSLVLILLAFAIVLFVLFFLNQTLFDLAVLLLRIDLLAFGGGFASVPLMLHEIVEVRHWIDNQTFMNGIVLGQVTPGPIVITATFIGYLLYGPLGGVIATASTGLHKFLGFRPGRFLWPRLRSLRQFLPNLPGLLPQLFMKPCTSIFLPSFMILVGISPYFDQLRTSLTFNKAIRGVLCSFVGLLLTVTIRFALSVHWDLSHLLLAGSALVALLLKVDILWVVLVGIVISVVLFI